MVSYTDPADYPNQRQNIKKICCFLENIRLENVYDEDTSEDSQSEELVEVNDHPSDIVSNCSGSEKITEQEWLENSIKSNQIIKYDYNSFENIEYIERGLFGGIYSAILKNESMKVVIKSIVVNSNSMELFVNENDSDKKISYIIERKREKPITGTPKSYIKVYQECWDQDPKQRPNIEKVTHGLNLLHKLLNQWSE
ncbi:2494_t:CDS:2 [Diversispora eburnea]|uniref:2494_t:CDS:1 n=1 Tax=Diversispora eburnea TaxID=1213867 RepID=A0A9N9FWW1_9GLOM|nr:2494_t:CDS:2 [Diversispora eburnea]